MLAGTRVFVEELDVAFGPLPARERAEVPAQPRRVPPPLPPDGRDGPDAEPEVVTPAPVGEVVPRAQVASSGPARLQTEVRRLVPAVARSDEPVDDRLEVALHGVGLPDELRPVRVGEPRPRHRLELVVREVLGPERKRLVDVSLEVGGALAGDPVQEIE